MPELTLVDQLEARIEQSPIMQLAKSGAVANVELNAFANDVATEVAFFYTYLHRIAEVVDALAGR